jgi:hypothetical protein
VNVTNAAKTSSGWSIALWVSVAMVVVPVLSMLPHVTSSADLVRIRNALLLDATSDAAVDWSPPNFPSGFKRETSPVPPVIAAAAKELGLLSIPSDWDRALAISAHLLGSHPVLTGGAIKSDLAGTYRRIVVDGSGYCGDFVRVFTAMANAAGVVTRPWAFSFDDFDGGGHIWLEIWNRQAQAWQLVGIFNNQYFVQDDDRPLSALELRQAMLRSPASVHVRRLYDQARPGFLTEAKSLEYIRRGLAQWYQLRGNNVSTYDANWLVSSLGGLSRAFEQMGGIITGVSPQVVILKDTSNKKERESLWRLRMQLFVVAAAMLIGSVGCSACFVRLVRRSSAGR